MTAINDTSFARVGKSSIIRSPGSVDALTGNDIAFDSNLTLNEKISTITGVNLTASSVANQPSGNISAQNVQDALNELDNEKATKATTLSGYGITDAYTKTQVDGMVGSTSAFQSIQNFLLGKINFVLMKFEEIIASIATKATDSGVVHNTGDETVAGTKTFSTKITGKINEAEGISSATTVVNTKGATAPTAGQVLTATSSTAATWQTPSAGVDILSVRSFL